MSDDKIKKMNVGWEIKDGEISIEFITEVLFYLQIFEREGVFNTSFDKVLNKKEVQLVELVGFSHKTNHFPYLEDEDPLGFCRRETDYVSSIHKTTD
tara:strand:+ start:9183 stop:9473 length:291 start_codon:yes stop_codon:yes gene_type:complete